MKKIIPIILVILLSFSFGYSQTLSFRLNNPRIVELGGSQRLRFDIEVKADAAGYYLHAAQVNLNFNTSALHATNFYVGLENGSLLAGTYVDPGSGSTNPRYNSPTKSVISGVYNCGFTAHYNPPPASDFDDFYNEVPTTWTQLGFLTTRIESASYEAGLIFNQATMNGISFYVIANGTSAFTNPNLYYEQMNELLLGKIYDDDYGWTLSDPAAGDGALYMSVWSGTAPITAAQATPAVVDQMRTHKHTTTGTIPSGYLSVEPGAGITVEFFNNQVEEGVIVQSDASGTGSLIINAMNGAGTYVVERYLSASGVSDNNYYFHTVAAPVDNQLLGDWNLNPDQTYAFQFDGSAGAWENIYNTGRSTVPGYGFLLSKIADGTPETVTFIDDIEIGNINGYGIYGTTGQYTLLGNPYTAPISWDAFHASQGGDVAAAVYIWEPAINAEGGNWRTYSAGGTGNASCEYIQVGQGFFVQNAADAPSVDFLASHRVHADEPYLKDEQVNTMKLYTMGGNGTNDELYIRFLDAEGVSGGFDIQFDAEKWASALDYATEINTVGTDGNKLSIDMRPPMEDNMISIPVDFKAAVEGEYSFGTEMLESFYSGIDIMLEDKNFPGSDWFDMREGTNYTFNAAPGDPINRFVLHFFDQTFGIDDKEISPITIYSHRNDAYIVNNTEQYIKEVLVYDLMGNLILNKVEVNASPLKLYISDKVGYYVVKVITDKAVYSEKVFISK